MKKNQWSIALRKGKLDAVVAAPGACDVGNNLVPPPLSPMQVGPSSPNFHESPPLVFAAAWAHPSGTEPMRVRPWFSRSTIFFLSFLLANQKRTAMAPCTLFHLVLSENNAVFLLWRFLFYSACLLPILTKKTAENNNPWFFI